MLESIISYPPVLFILSLVAGSLIIGFGALALKGMAKLFSWLKLAVSVTVMFLGILLLGQFAITYVLNIS